MRFHVPDPQALAATLPLMRLDATIPANARPYQCPVLAETLARFRSPFMQRDVRFALVREPTNPHAKPVAMATMASLARAIHTARRGAPIVLENARLFIRGWDEEVMGVSVTTLTEGGDPDRYITWAWINGADRQVLQRALDNQVGNVPAIGRAA